MSLKERLIKRIKEQPSGRHELKVYFKFDNRIDKILSRLIKKGKIKKENGKYVYLKTGSSKIKQQKKLTTIEAVVVKHTGRYAFATPVDGGDDFFIPGRELNSALLGDKVLISPYKKDGRESAKVLSIISQHNRVTGKVVLYYDRLAVMLDGYNETLIAPIKRGADLHAQLGESVAIDIVSRKGDDLRCEVKRRFGESNSAIAAAKAIIFNAGLRTHFNTAIKSEVNKMVADFNTATLHDDRIDLRDTLVFTIDGADTKDIDDAISLQKTKNGYILGVHIADVSHYVKFDSAVEHEAFERQYSFYYPNGVIPMLPAELSNGLCSLSPKEDRLCFSCIMELSATGEIISSSFIKTIIRSRFKGVYSEVNALLDGTATDKEKAKYRGAITTLKSMKKLASLLNSRREKRGSIDFNLKETGFKLDKDKVESIYFKDRGESERMIEEFMLMANNATASVAKEIGLPVIYRVHDMPNMEKLDSVKTILSTAYNENIDIPSAEVTSLQIANFIRRYNDTPLEYFVNNSVLRCMAKAEYSVSAQGHFGLAIDDYCHFTSPIRRYSDFFTHHVLSEFISKKSKKEIVTRYLNRATEVATKANSQEQLFVRAERTINDCFKAEAMVEHLGDIFEGSINGVTENGIFVLLDNSAEGRIAITDLSQHYLLIEENYRLYSGDGEVEFKIGDRISVKIVAVQVDTGRIDMVPEDYQ